MDSIRTFLEMGGYAAFVWPAFGVTTVLMAGLFFWSRHTLRSDRRTLDLLQDARREARRGAGGDSSDADT